MKFKYYFYSYEKDGRFGGGVAMSPNNGIFLMPGEGKNILFYKKISRREFVAYMRCSEEEALECEREALDRWTSEQ